MRHLVLILLICLPLSYANAKDCSQKLKAHVEFNHDFIMDENEDGHNHSELHSKPKDFYIRSHQANPAGDGIDLYEVTFTTVTERKLLSVNWTGQPPWWDTGESFYSIQFKVDARRCLIVEFEEQRLSDSFLK